MEETYWYRIDRNQIGVNVSGKNQGCKYITEPCVTPGTYEKTTHEMKVENTLDFCAKLGDQGVCEYCKGGVVI